jgi:2'-5' RNA ligase
MIETPRFSLWLLLPREAHARFQAIIARLSAQLGTPAFEPHITLLGGLSGAEEDLRQRTRVLACAIKPFEARLLKVAWLDDYYRCLFVEVVPSRALHAAHEAAGRQFDRHLGTRFYPHLSLVYGELEKKEKEKILDNIGRSFDESACIDNLALYDISGPPSVWRCVECVGLGGGSRAARPD